MLTLELLEESVRRGSSNGLESASKQRLVAPDPGGMNLRAFDYDGEQRGAGRIIVDVPVSHEIRGGRDKVVARPPNGGGQPRRRGT